MEYKYSPIFKYIMLLLVIFMFIKHLHILHDRDIFLLTISLVVIFMIFDYIIIKQHPTLIIMNDDESTDEYDINMDKELDQIIKNYDNETRKEQQNNKTQLEKNNQPQNPTRTRNETPEIVDLDDY